MPLLVAIEGTLAVISGPIVPYAGASFYTRYGDLFAWGTVGVALVTVLAPFGLAILRSRGISSDRLPAREG